MALALSFNEKQIKTPYVTFDRGLSAFFLKDVDGLVDLSISFRLEPKTEYLVEDYEIVFLHNPYLNAENDIFEVYLNDPDTRIGWVFPLQALVSDEHDKASNVHFLKYAFVAFNKLLLNHENFQINNLNYSPSISLSLEDFYPKDLIILIISKDKKSLVNNFSIEDYLPSLSVFGYYIYKINDNKKPINNYQEIEDYFINIRVDRQRLTLKKMCSTYSDNFYIKQLYKNLLNGVLHPLMRFHYLYQIIELMSEDLYEVEFLKSIEDYSSKKLTRNDLRENLTSLNERKRLGKIITENSIEQSIKTDLFQECNKILTDFEKEANDSSDALYDLRNLITHNFRKITERQEHLSTLEYVNFRFELLINELLINFKEEMLQTLTLLTRKQGLSPS
jgi:F0F1-type ATP synthase delta subunit